MRPHQRSLLDNAQEGCATYDPTEQIVLVVFDDKKGLAQVAVANRGSRHAHTRETVDQLVHFCPPQFTPRAHARDSTANRKRPRMPQGVLQCYLRALMRPRGRMRPFRTSA